MPSTTPISALRYAVQTDAAVAQTGFQNLAEDLDGLLIPRYATTAARDAAIPSPTQGMFCYISSTASGGRTLMQYTGSAWVPLFRAPLFAVKSATESVTSSTVVQADNHLVLAMEANTTYVLNMWLNYVGSDAGDFKYDFTYPASCSVANGTISYTPGSTGAAPVINALSNQGFDASTPTTDLIAGTITGVTANLLVNGVVSTSSTAGNLTLMWAQNTSDPTATTLHPGSYLMLTRVV